MTRERSLIVGKNTVFATLALLLVAGLVWMAPLEERTSEAPAPPKPATRSGQECGVWPGMLVTPEMVARAQAEAEGEDEDAGEVEARETTPLEAYTPLPPRPARPGRIAGWVLGPDGRPAKAHLDLVAAEGGCVSYDTEDEGAFEIARQGYETFQLKATADGLVGVFTAERIDGSLGVSDVVIPLRKAARVRVELKGARESSRCALITGGIRHTDFTLRRGKPAKEIVPPGDCEILLYNGSGRDLVVHARRSLHLAADSFEGVAFTLDR